MISEAKTTPEIRISFENIIRKIDRLGQVITMKLFKLKPEEVTSVVEDWDTNKFEISISRRKFVSRLAIGSALTIFSYKNRSDIFNIIAKPKESAINIYKNTTINFPADRFFEKYKFGDIKKLSVQLYDSLYSKIIPNKEIAIEKILSPINRVVEMYYYLAEDISESNKTPEKFAEHATNFHQRVVKFCNKYHINLFTQLSFLDKAAGVSTVEDNDSRSTIEIYFQELQERFIQLKLRRLAIINPLIVAEVTKSMIVNNVASNLRKFDAPRVIQSETTLGHDVENEMYALSILELTEEDRNIFQNDIRDKFNQLLNARSGIESSRNELQVISNSLANLLQEKFDNPKNKIALQNFFSSLGISDHYATASAWQQVSYTRTYMNGDSKDDLKKIYFESKFLTKEFFSDQINHPNFIEYLEKFIKETGSSQVLVDSVNILQTRSNKFRQAKLKYIEIDEFIAYNIIPKIERNSKMSEMLLLSYPLYLQKKSIEFLDDVLRNKKLSDNLTLSPENFLLTTTAFLNREVAPINVLLSGKFAMDSTVDMPYNFDRMDELLTSIIRDIYKRYDTNNRPQIEILKEVGAELAICFYRPNSYIYSTETMTNIAYLTATPSAALITALKFNQEQMHAMNYIK